jgi:16S rRNA (adenine1518-N6/adenine1519-N6)-dimethyltransferase
MYITFSLKLIAKRQKFINIQTCLLKKVILMADKELLDIVNEQDVVIKKGVAREEAHAKKLLHRAIIVFVFNSKGQIFVQERSPAKDVYPGLMIASCSGHVNAGETYKEAAVRELNEELAVETTPNRIERVAEFKVTNPQDVENDALFVLEGYDKPIIVNRQEIISGKYVSIVELRRQVISEPRKFAPPFLRAFDIWSKKAGA